MAVIRSKAIVATDDDGDFLGLVGRDGALIQVGEQLRGVSGLIKPGKAVMSSPPTVTVVADIAPTIPTRFDVGPMDPRVLSNCALAIFSPGWVADGANPVTIQGDAPGTLLQRQPGGPQTHSIITDADKVAVKVFGYQGVPKIQLKVGGEYVEAAARNVPNTSAYTWFVLTFASREARVISALLFGDTCMFCGFTVPATAAVHDMPPQRREVLFGDSYVFGDSLTVPGDTLAVKFAEKLGSLSVWPSGSGGSGYKQAGYSGAPAAMGRLQSDLLPYLRDGDRVWLLLGTNDWGYSASEVASEMIKVIRAIREAAAGVRIVAGTSWRPRSGSTSNGQFDDAMIAAARSEGVRTVDLRRLFTGTGRVGATANNGNSDVCINTDAVHPTAIGADVAAHALALVA